MTPAQAFDLGFNWARRLTGQNIEDSRAVGRTLMSDDFASLNLDVDAVPSFKGGDEGIVAAKCEIMRGLDAVYPFGEPMADNRETVAIAIFLKKNGPKSKWDTFPERYKEGYRGLADAAICAASQAEKDAKQ